MIPIETGYFIDDAERALIEARDRCPHGSALWGLLETAIAQTRAADRCFNRTRKAVQPITTSGDDVHHG